MELLSDEQAEAYGTFAEEPTTPGLERFLVLDDVDRDLIALRRTKHHQLGFASRMRTVRLPPARGRPALPAQAPPELDQETGAERTPATGPVFRLLELRYKVELHYHTGRVVECPLDEINRPRASVDVQLHIEV